MYERAVIRAAAAALGYNIMVGKKRFVFRLHAIRLGGKTHAHTHNKHTVNAKTQSPRCVGAAVVAVATNYTPPSLLA